MCQVYIVHLPGWHQGLKWTVWGSEDSWVVTGLASVHGNSPDLAPYSLLNLGPKLSVAKAFSSPLPTEPSVFFSPLGLRSLSPQSATQLALLCSHPCLVLPLPQLLRAAVSGAWGWLIRAGAGQGQALAGVAQWTHWRH